MPPGSARNGRGVPPRTFLTPVAKIGSRTDAKTDDGKITSGKKSRSTALAWLCAKATPSHAIPTMWRLMRQILNNSHEPRDFGPIGLSYCPS